MYIAQVFQPSSKGYEALVALNRIVTPYRRLETAAEFEQEDANWPSDSRFDRFVVYVGAGEEVVAVATCYEAYWRQQRGTGRLHFCIHPDCLQTQILTILYDAMWRLLKRQESKVQKLESGAKEDDTTRVKFLLEKGFRQVMRSPSAALCVAGADPEVFARYGERLAEETTLYLHPSSVIRIGAGVETEVARLALGHC